MQSLMDEPPTRHEWMPVECACGCDGLTWEPIPAASSPERWAVPGQWERPAAEPRSGVRRLVALVEELGRISSVGLSDAEALAEAEAILEVRQALRLQLLPRFADLQDRPLEALRFRSVTTWVKATSPDANSGDVSLARKLQKLPTLNEAVTERRVTLVATRQVNTALGKMRGFLDRPNGLIDGQLAEPVVFSVVGNVVSLVAQARGGLDEDSVLLSGVRERVARIQAAGGSQLSRVEAACTLLAELLPAGHLKAALEELEGALLPVHLDEQQERAEDRAYAQLDKNPDGSWQLQARLSPECGERLFTALGAEARRDPANPLDTAAREAARVEGFRDPVTGELPDPFRIPLAEHEPWERPSREGEELVPRSRSKRLHDALHRLLERYLDTGLGGIHDKIPVQISATVSAALLEGKPGALPAKGGSGRPLSRRLLKRWWCDAHVTTLLISQGWKPLGVVHTGRTLTGVERKAAAVQFNGRCAGVGCCPGQPDPLIALVPHHVIGHAVAGKTSLGETILACPSLHHDLHTGKRTIQLRDGRLLNETGYVTDEQ